jgi:2-polyprenyl-3-methyl-5-hydroxy-6-metoxy-1,4-benzoquinol methylase
MPTFSEQRTFYNRLWETVGAAELNRHELARLERIRAELDARFPETHPPVQILEIGCGRGWLSGLVLAEHGVVRALDLSDASIAKARAQFPAIEFEAANIFEITLDASYDVVVASEVIEHIDDKPRFVGVLGQAVKPGGLVIMTTPNARHFDRWKKTAPFEQPLEEWVTPRQLRQLLEVDFDISSSTTFFFYIGSGVLNRALNNRVSRFIRRTGSVDDVLGRLGLGLYGITVGRRR